MPSQLDELIAVTHGRIDAWRAEARTIADQARDAEERGSVEADQLVFIEELARAIFQEVDNLERFRTSIRSLNENATISLAQLGDGLRLVLLEITELGNRMYRIPPVSGGSLPEWILRAEALPLPPLAAALTDALSPFLAEGSVTQSETSVQSLTEFASSSNGDRWFYGTVDEQTGQAFVEHRANAPSGGAITRTAVTTFLERGPEGPEHEALRQLIAGPHRHGINERPRRPTLHLRPDTKTLRRHGQRAEHYDRS